jgi:site-specific recombinase XerD
MGANAFALQNMLGHTTLEMTTHYLHMAQADVERIARAMGPMATLGAKP